MAHKNSFSISEALSYGWKTFKKNWQFLVVATLFYLIVRIVTDSLTTSTEKNLPGMHFLINILGFLALSVMEIGGVKIALKIIDSKVPKLDDLYKHYDLLLNYVITLILYVLLFIVGLVFLIVPGVYFGLKYYFALNFVIDKKMGPLESFKASAKITEGMKWRLLGFSLICIGLTILGLLAFGVGVLIAIPVTVLADAYLYRKLAAR